MQRKTSNINATVVLTSWLAIAGTAVMTHAADLSWSGGTGTYNNPAAWGGAVPGVGDRAINATTTNDVVQINIGDPDWTLDQLLAGYIAGDGAYEQNGQTVTLSGAPRALRLGSANGSFGLYTLNGGAINYGAGEFTVGELGEALLNINGGSITGSGTFAVNAGSSLDAVTATVDGGTNKTGYTWFEQGLYAPDPLRGLPAEGSTFASEALPTHSFTMAPDYTVNNAVLVYTNVPFATITPTSPVAASGLSFLGSAGDGATTINYTVHFADTTSETGSFVVKDWFANDGNVAWRSGGRVPANGLGFQIINDGPNKPYVLSQDIVITNATSAITSVDLQYASGGKAVILAVSSSTGGNFTPLAVTGYNADMILEVNAPIYVSQAITNVVNQTAGTMNVTGQVWVGNYGSGIFNMEDGTNNFGNWVMVGRSGGKGTFNLTDGRINKAGNEHFIVADGPGSLGEMNQSGGAFDSTKELWVGQNGGTGTYNLSSGILSIHDWTAIGRSGGTGTFNFTGGSFTKDGNGHFIVADNGSGTFNHSTATLDSAKELWVGQGGSAVGTYNLSSGTLNVHDWVAIGRSGGKGTFNMTGGTFTKDGNGDFLVAANNGSIGVLNHSAGTITSTKAFLVPQNGNSSTLGTYNLSGSAEVNLSDWFAVGRDGGSGILNMTGGTFNKTGGGSFIIGASGPGTFTMSAGTLNVTGNDTWISEGNTATWNMSGGTANLGYVQFARNGSGVATLNFDGGVIGATEIVGGAGNGTINLNGGTIVARASAANFMHDIDVVSILAGGVTVDTSTNVIGVAQALAGAGNLTKVGTGALNLNGVNSYTGSTLVNVGSLGGSGTISGPVSVATGATLAPGAGLGTLTINNTLSLAAGSTTFVEVSNDGGVMNSDLVTGLTGLTYGGSLVVSNVGAASLQTGNVFKLFNSTPVGAGNFTSVTILPSGTGTFNPATGEVTINSTGIVVLNPPVAVDGDLILTGSGDPGTAYSILTSTNLALPLSQWTTNVSGTVDGSGSISNAISIDTSEPARFFLLRQP